MVCISFSEPLEDCSHKVVKLWFVSNFRRSRIRGLDRCGHGHQNADNRVID